MKRRGHPPARMAGAAAPVVVVAVVVVVVVAVVQVVVGLELIVTATQCTSWTVSTPNGPTYGAIWCARQYAYVSLPLSLLPPALSTTHNPSRFPRLTSTVLPTHPPPSPASNQASSGTPQASARAERRAQFPYLQAPERTRWCRS